MISFKRDFIIHALVALTKVTVFALAMSDGHQDKCKDSRQNGVDAGLVRVPDFQDNVPPNVTCSWSFTAPPGKKLLVKVDSVHYPPQDIRDTTLKLFLDEEIIDIPRNCVKCLKQLVSGHSVRVSYSSNLLPSNTNPDVGDTNDDSRENALYADAGSFQIRYKAFDPLVCEKPRTPINGDAVVISRKLGQEVKYHCNPPYDLFGKNSAVCQIPVDSPVPEWSNGPPKCGISNCSNVPIRRKADGSSPGAISSPGYPNFKIHTTFDCEWIITADKGYQISSFLSYLELSEKDAPIASLRLYDGLERTLISSALVLHRNVTTRSNVLSVVFQTNNTGLTEGGFFMNYIPVPASCPNPEIPENGEVVGYSFLVGSTIVFRCSSGFVLEGGNQAECLMNGLWSITAPVCSNISTETNLTMNSRTNLESSSQSSFEPVSETISPTVLPDLKENVDSVIPILKVSKSNKKAKLIPTSKVPSKSTAKPKRKDNDSIKPEEVLVTPVLEWETADAINDTQDEVKVPRTLQNGIMVKTKDSKNDLDNANLLPDKRSQDYNGGNLDEDETVEEEDLDDSQLGGFNIIPNAPSSPSSKPTESADKSREKGADEDISLVTTYIVIGISIGGLLVLVSIIVMLVVYRKKFPVRMRFGRKFSTFENPMYVANKDQDAQHPRELKRLTV